MIKRIWDWIKTHTAWLAGGIVALGVGYYLLSHSGGGGGGATTVSFPPSSTGGGGGGGAPPSGGGAPPSGINGAGLPYSPDTSIIGALTDNALKALYNNLVNLENQANQAFLSGNTSLLTQLQSQIASIQGQIANYQPTTGGTPTLTGWITQAGQNLLPGQIGYWNELLQWINGNQSSVSAGAAQLWQELVNTYGVPVGFQGLIPQISQPPLTGGGGGTPSWTVPTVTQSLVDQLVAAYNGALQKSPGGVPVSTQYNFWSSILNIPQPVAQYVVTQSDQYTSQTGIRSTPTQIQNWIQQAYNQGIGSTAAVA